MIVRDISELNIGKLIATIRMEKGITQEDLSRGICSITYLSKLENGKIEPSAEILRFICEKLNIKFSHMQKENQKLKSEIEELYYAINIDNQDLAERLYNSISEKDIYTPEMNTYYLLILYRYYIYKADKNNIEIVFSKLKKIKKTFNKDQLAYYYHFSGLSLHLNQNYKKAINLLVDALYLHKEAGYVDFQLLYHLGLVYSLDSKVASVFEYILPALHYFQDDLNYKRVIDCQIILGINYTRIKEYDKALECYNKVLKLTQSIPSKSLIAKVYHNMGFLYYRLKDYSKSINFYEKSLALKKEYEELYSNTLFYLILVYVDSTNYTEATKLIERGLTLTTKHNHKSLNIRMNILNFSISPGEKSLYVDYLQKVAVPFFKSRDDFKNLADCYERLGDLLVTDHNFYKKGSHYYKLALNLSKN